MMNMLNTFTKRAVILSTLSAIVLLSGCQNRDARYVDSGGTETIVSLNQINIQDWSNAAEQMVNSLLTSGVLERAPEQPAILGISRIINNTQQQVDTDALVKKIRVALNQSGKAVTTTTIGVGDDVEDPLAKSSGEYENFMNDEPQGKRPMPHFTLSGKLLEDRVRADNKRQVTYTFQLSLTEVGSGLALWEDEKQITKMGERPSVGW